MTRLLLIVLTILPLALRASQAHAYGLGSADNIQQTYDCLHAAAKRYGHRPALVFGIAAQESSFNPRAVSYINGKPIAYGVMQVYFDVHQKALGADGVRREDLFNPCIGAKHGARILYEFMQVHGNSWKAVGAYYAGNRFQNEKDRQWYANQVASKVRWFEQHGTESILKSSYSVNSGKGATIAKRSRNGFESKPLIASNPILARNTSMVAWEATQ
jgi:soluble lytic murein transglycosylase-like protein